MKRIFVVLIALTIAYSAFAAGSSLRLGVIGSIEAPVYIDSTYSVKDLRLGAQLDLSTLVSIRPSLILYVNTEKSENISDGLPEYKNRSFLYIGGSVDVPFHLARFSNGSIYAGPSILYMSIKELRFYNPTDPYLGDEDTTTIFSIGALVGGQYQFNKSFSCFLDTGLEFVIENFSSKDYNLFGTTTDNMETTDTSFRFKAPSIGLCFYLN